MKQVRTYGEPPFTIALVHGGPGATGEMEPVASVLAGRYGVIEPLQTMETVEGQIEELREDISGNASLPVTLAGFSWGAWLSFMFAARYPESVRKLILISSGSFTEEYAPQIMETRLQRMGEENMREFRSLLASFDSLPEEDKPAANQRFADIFTRSDHFDPLPPAPGVYGDANFQAHIFQSVWPEAAELRRSGKLISYAEQITCPVVAIHGDYDPHPAEGVEKPLGDALADFRFILLENCGHTPWIEKHAREAFYEALGREL